MKKANKKNKNRFQESIGLIIVGLNISWLWRNIDLLNGHQNFSILYFVMIPKWILLIGVILSLFGVFIGMEVWNNKRKLKNGILISLILFLIGFAFEIVEII